MARYDLVKRITTLEDSATRMDVEAREWREGFRSYLASHPAEAALLASVEAASSVSITTPPADFAPAMRDRERLWRLKTTRIGGELAGALLLEVGSRFMDWRRLTVEEL